MDEFQAPGEKISDHDFGGGQSFPCIREVLRVSWPLVASNCHKFRIAKDYVVLTTEGSLIYP